MWSRDPSLGYKVSEFEQNSKGDRRIFFLSPISSGEDSFQTLVRHQTLLDLERIRRENFVDEARRTKDRSLVTFGTKGIARKAVTTGARLERNASEIRRTRRYSIRLGQAKRRELALSFLRRFEIAAMHKAIYLN